jgi:hypothetical protein
LESSITSTSNAGALPHVAHRNIANLTLDIADKSTVKYETVPLFHLARSLSALEKCERCGESARREVLYGQLLLSIYLPT